MQGNSIEGLHVVSVSQGAEAMGYHPTMPSVIPHSALCTLQASILANYHVHSELLVSIWD